MSCDLTKMNVSVCDSIEEAVLQARQQEEASQSGGQNFLDGASEAAWQILTAPEKLAKYVTGTDDHFGQNRSWLAFGRSYIDGFKRVIGVGNMPPSQDIFNDPVSRTADSLARIGYGALNTLSVGSLHSGFEAIGLDSSRYTAPPPASAKAWGGYAAGAFALLGPTVVARALPTSVPRIQVETVPTQPTTLATIRLIESHPSYGSAGTQGIAYARFGSSPTMARGGHPALATALKVEPLLEAPPLGLVPETLITPAKVIKLPLKAQPSPTTSTTVAAPLPGMAPIVPVLAPGSKETFVTEGVPAIKDPQLIESEKPVHGEPQQSPREGVLGISASAGKGSDVKASGDTKKKSKKGTKAADDDSGEAKAAEKKTRKKAPPIDIPDEVPDVVKNLRNLGREAAEHGVSLNKFLEGLNDPYAKPQMPVWQIVDKTRKGLAEIKSGASFRDGEREAVAILKGAAEVFPAPLKIWRPLGRIWFEEATRRGLRLVWAEAKQIVNYMRIYYILGRAGGLPPYVLSKSLHNRNIPFFLGTQGWLVGRANAVKESNPDLANALTNNMGTIMQRAVNQNDLAHVSQLVDELPRMLQELDAATVSQALSPEIKKILTSNRGTIISAALRQGDLHYVSRVVAALPKMLEKMDATASSGDLSKEAQAKIVDRRGPIIWMALRQGDLNFDNLLKSLE